MGTTKLILLDSLLQESLPPKAMMLSSKLLTTIRSGAMVSSGRHLGMAAPAMTAAADPIQQLFVNKIQEYGAKKEASGGKMVDANPTTEAQLQSELDKVAKAYGGGPGVDMTAFPVPSFKEPALDPINVGN